MKITFKYLSMAILSFIGGIQFHRGWTIRRQLSHSLDNGSGNSIGHRSINNNNDNNDDGDDNDGDDNESGIGSVARSSSINNNSTTTMTTPTNEAMHSSTTTTAIPATATIVTEKVRIILLGERHSGTNWITDHLKECFQGKAADAPAAAALEGNTTTTTTAAAANNTTTATAVTVTVTNEYTRYKHWYQEDTMPQNNNTIMVVIVLFRDPIDWIEAMRYEPHHAHDHVQFHEKYNNIQQRQQQQQQHRNQKLRKHPSNIYWRNIAKPLSWKEFVTRPWMGKRGPKDVLIRQQIDAAALRNNDNQSSSSSGSSSLMNDIRCMDNYQYVDATPCSIEDVTVVKGLGEYKYEYHPDKSERGYGSILQLRSLKIRNHLSIRNYTSVNAYLPYRFEGLRINGTMSLINDVRTATGLVADCNPIYGKNSSRQSVDGSIVKEKMIGNNNNNNNNITSSSQQKQRRQLGRKKVTETRELPIEYIQYMNRNVNWDVERLIGYFPRIL